MSQLQDLLIIGIPVIMIFILYYLIKMLKDLKEEFGYELKEK